ncbi:MAG: hypothetical protein CUN56_15750, partial [Phototrophicales bacterium]
MIVQKYFKGILDADSEAHLLSEGVWVNAHNVNVRDDANGGANVVKQVPGTYQATTRRDDKRVIGDYYDARWNRQFFFRYATDGLHDIICFDGGNTYIVFMADIVKGGLAWSVSNPIHSVQMAGDLLYFCDGVSPPMRINVER